PLEGADPPERLEIRLRRQLERRRDVCELPPQEARHARPAAHPHCPPGGLHARSGGVILGRLSLRARLLLGVVVLSAVGLALADVATYTSLRAFMLDRVDKTLEAGHVQVEQTAFGKTRPARGGGDGGPGGGPGPPAQGIDWYEVRTLSGAVVKSGFLV